MCRNREYMLAIAARKLEDLWVHDSRDTMLDWLSKITHFDPLDK